MKLKLIAFAVGLSIVGIAKADLLYWQISNPVDVQQSIWSSTPLLHDDSYYAYAKLVDVNTGKAWDNYGVNSSGNLVYGSLVTVTGNASMGEVAANLGTSYSGGSFYIVLYDSSKTELGRTENLSYSDYSQYIQSYDAEVTAAQFDANWKTAQTLTNVTFVPEPTSGLLMLVGAALLGLRRKRIA